ncbi:tetratricopeptide repeat-containing sensor histidine kinase [Winogradskyella undariae]|uniref:tetratricopeptide repeat-containing sensor histidine kinase n=1 Tax=Winogradskyella undariae TaxID=1285465 RepID=UPI0015CD62FD|nr:hypothetical protein [Winogradskyella undariae]
MISIKKSFFFTIFVILGLFSIQKISAQHYVDSVSYYSKLALQPQKANDLVKAKAFFKNNIRTSIKIKDTKHTLLFLYYMASVDFKLGAYDESEETVVKALKLIDTMGNTPYAIAIKKSFYNLLGIIYQENKNQTKALKLYNKTLVMATTTADSVIIYNNISNVYKSDNDSANTKKVLIKAYKLIPRLKDTLTQALILDNLGMVYLGSKPSSALPLINRALNLREIVKDTSKIYTSFIHLAEYYKNRGDTMTSKTYALKALNFAKRLKSSSYKNRALGILTVISNDQYARDFKELNDSIEKAEQEDKYQFAMIRYEVSKKELELEQSERIKERIIIVSVFIVTIIVFFGVYQKFKYKKEKLQEVYETESKISKRIHDEVANDLFHIMTRLEDTDEVAENIKNDLHNLYYKTRDISKEHDVINTELPFLHSLSELIDSFNNEDTNIIIKSIAVIPWEAIPKLNKTTIYKVLQELLINMKKHSEATIVVFIFSLDRKKVTISYSDNGVGCDLKKGSGLQNTENRIQAINGTITFESDINKGFKTKIRV